MKIDHDNIINIIKETADNIIMPYWGKLSPNDVNIKTHNQDFVTKVDVESENFLTQQLLKITPKALVLGEETANKVKDKKQFFESNDLIWVLDPVDGTYNFVNANYNFGIIVSLLYKNETIGGWIYMPISQSLIKTEKNAGVYNENGDKLSLQVCFSKEAEAKGFLETEKETKTKLMASQLKAKIPNITWTNCSASSYTSLIKGDFDFFISNPSQISPWDNLAGVLAYSEMGGITKLIDKSEYKAKTSKGAIINACTESLWQYLQDLYLNTSFKEA